MKINISPMGILVGSVYNYKSRADAYVAKLNWFDQMLVVNSRCSDGDLLPELHRINDITTSIPGKGPILSPEIYYKYMLGTLDAISPIAMFDSPEKSQVYLDIIHHGAINAPVDRIVSLFGQYEILTLRQAWETESMHHMLNSARTVKEVLRAFKDVARSVHNHIVEDDETRYFPTLDAETRRWEGDSPLVSSKALITSRGELLVKLDYYTSERGRDTALMYLTDKGDLRFLIEYPMDKRTLKHIFKTVCAQGKKTGLPRVIYNKILYSMYEESGDLFDFAMDISWEQRRNILVEGVSAGFSSGIKHPQDGSITDLIASIANKVTMETYSHGRLVSCKKCT